MPSLRPHWSYSRISQYLRCPLQYYFERIVGIPRPFVLSNMLFGSAIHAGLAMYHRALQVGEVLGVTSLHEEFLATWSETEAKQPISYSGGNGKHDLLAKSEALLATYLEEPPPEHILAVEARYMVPLVNSRGEYLNKPLEAVLDLVCMDDTGVIVQEFKTSSRRYGERELDTALQATCYTHTIEQRWGEVPRLEYVVLVKTQKPAVQRLSVGRSEYDFARLGDLVESVERAVAAEIFYPHESPLNCSGCPYRLECLEWQGTKQQQPELVPLHPLTVASSRQKQLVIL
ncbi:MAG: PD-(D/E)XK nuclease family protein [Pirellulales bacterium]